MTDERERLATAKSKLWEVLSNSKYNGDPNTATEVEYRPIADVIKLNAAKTEMRDLLAGVQSRGITDVTRDSSDTNTESGTPFVGQNSITCRGRNYLEMLADQKAKLESQPSPSPAVNGQGNWSTDSASEPNGEFNAADAKSDLIKAFTGADGKIRKQQAQKWFLTVSGDGSTPDAYNVPLGTVSPVSQEISYHPDALAEAWKHASGDYNATVNRSQQNRIVRIAQRNKMPLTDSMQSHMQRHMAATSPFYDIGEPTDAEKDLAVIKTMSKKRRL